METKHKSSQWKNVDSPRPKKAKVTKSLGKNMYSPYIKSFLWGMRFDNLSELRQAVMNVIAEESRHFSIDLIVALFPGHK
jgi:hypothetical protein